MSTQDYKGLSHRERQILEADWDGLSVKVVASRLRLSPRTVEYHKAMILRKSHCSSILTAWRLALKRRDLKI